MASRVTNAAREAQGRIKALAGLSSTAPATATWAAAKDALANSGEAINMYGSFRKGDRRRSASTRRSSRCSSRKALIIRLARRIARRHSRQGARQQPGRLNEGDRVMPLTSSQIANGLYAPRYDPSADPKYDPFYSSPTDSGSSFDKSFELTAVYNARS